MPDIHQSPPAPLPRFNPPKPVGHNSSLTRPITTYGSRRTHLAPAKPTDSRSYGANENYPEGMAGPSSSVTRVLSPESSSLTPPPGSQPAAMSVDELDEGEQSEEEMALDGEDDEDRTNGAESSAGRSVAGGSDVGVESEWSDDDDSAPKVILHVEVRRVARHMNRNPHSDDTLSKSIGQYIRYMEDTQSVGSDLNLKEWGNEPILRNVDKVFFAETEPASETFKPSEVEIRWHFYWISAETDLEQFTAVTEDDDEDDAVPAASVRELPSMELEGIWENLIYSTDLKPRLLRYINSTMAFSDAKVDFNKVSWNRLVLLHGPPGTGKTSLCRALAQKLLVRMGGTYRAGKLVEINSHSLFSKWFSESGKLVQKLFSRVTEMVEDQQTLVVVMIDEVESLTAARSAAVNGSEPSDALRVVNALLTQLDKLKTRPNVLVMTTSNIPDTIDSAFIDRADEKFFVDYPPPEAVYWILKGCLAELAEKGMMRPCAVSTVQEVQLRRWKTESSEDGERKGRLRGKERADEAGAKLWKIAKLCHDHTLAGRFLRRLPLLAHSHYLSVTTKKDDDGRPIPRSIEKWLDAFSRVVHDEIADRARIGKKTHTTMANGHSEESRG